MRLNNLGYLIKEGFKGIFKHGFMSFASVTIIMACLIIMGVFTLLGLNINRVIADLEAQNEIVAFVDDSYTTEDAKKVGDRLLQVDNVADVDFISRSEAMNTFKKDYEQGLFDEIDETVFRDRYVVHVQDIELTAQTRDKLESVEGIAKVNAHLQYAEGFIKVRNIVNLISAVLVSILAIISVFIMSNTIKLATYNRREEIAIMKMVGATNMFIRLPFIIEGLLLGILGGGLAFGSVWGLYELTVSKLVGGFIGGIMDIVPFSVVMLPLLVVFMGIGVFVGAFGGNIAIRDYLKV
ncbi:MAG: permease-like cell division protein FtsX [Oscillospiraceae bacterium]|nr:permease-like cell division protein FtsX [Oscillospiraceae bacterium]